MDRRRFLLTSLAGALIAPLGSEALQGGKVHLDTHSCQAPDFYRHRGYETLGELPGWPDQTTRIFLRKIL